MHPLDPTESNEPYIRERWEATKKELAGHELQIAQRVEYLMAEFDPPVWSLSRAHFVQTVVATASRVEATHDERSHLARVVRRQVLGGRPA